MVADPHHFIENLDSAFYLTANPDPAFYLNPDPDLAPLQSAGIFDHWSKDPPGLHFEPPDLFCERPRICLEPLKQCGGSMTFWYRSGSADPDLCSD
jgi:hypothetical protein